MVVAITLLPPKYCHYCYHVLTFTGNSTQQ